MVRNTRRAKNKKIKRVKKGGKIKIGNMTSKKKEMRKSYSFRVSFRDAILGSKPWKGSNRILQKCFRGSGAGKTTHARWKALPRQNKDWELDRHAFGRIPGIRSQGSDITRF